MKTQTDVVLSATGHADHPTCGIPSIENLARSVTRHRQKVVPPEPTDLNFKVSLILLFHRSTKAASGVHISFWILFLLHPQIYLTELCVPPFVTCKCSISSSLDLQAVIMLALICQHAELLPPQTGGVQYPLIINATSSGAELSFHLDKFERSLITA